MTFDEILDQIIGLLQRQGRASYGALKRRFDLDDALLEDLKGEILYVHPVRDEEGRGLVWTGDPRAVRGAALSRTGPDGNRPDAERRQLTVMFCDLVGSTMLSSRLDPEDYREVVRAYQAACTEVVQRYEGHVAQLLGDGLLVYFGYPTAHEQDAERAIHAGLGIVAAIDALSGALGHTGGITLGVRLGIHTGLVVVGDMGETGRQEQLALGEVPNVAARIEGLATPNTVAISEATARLVRGYFECEGLGEQSLRGVAEPVHVYRVVRASGAKGRLDAGAPRGLTPLVGREAEVGLLRERWDEVRAGRGQVVLLSGDAGIGKSRLVHAVREHIANVPHVRWECRSSPYHQDTSLYPLLERLQRALPWPPDDTPDQRLGRLERMLSRYRLPLAESVPLFATLLSIPLDESRYPPLPWTPPRRRQKTLESILAVVLETAEREPVLFIVEDLHWTDPSTLDFLALLIEHVATAPVYVLLTCRPTFRPPWTHRTYLSEIAVTRLSSREAGQVVERVTGGKPLPPAVLQQLCEKSDGVPLYLEEMTRAVLESGHLKEAAGQYELAGPLAALSVPATLQDSLMARLDRLVSAKGIAQLGAVIGRQFSFGLLKEVSRLDDITLRRELGRLLEAELVYQRGALPQATYLFKHQLVQDVAYQSLLRTTRQTYHRRIAEVLVDRFADTVEREPEVPARHFTAAGLNEQAITYWQRAGELAVARSANQEAIHHLTRGRELLAALPLSSDRTQRELDLLTKLGPALMAAKGYADAEVEETYARARDLCQEVEQTPQLFPVLWGLWLFSTARARHRTARALGEELLGLARHLQDAALLLEAHHALWTTLFHLGEVGAAHAHAEQGLALYRPTQHHAHTAVYGGHDPGICAGNFGSRALWLLGYPERARQWSQAALSLAQQLSHPFSLALSRYVAAMLHQLRREPRVVRDEAEAGLAIGTAHGFPYVVALSTALRGWALAEQRDVAAGLTQMQQGTAGLRATGNETLLPWLLAALGEAQGKARHVEEGLVAVAEALGWVERNEERSVEAELRRLQGELLLAGAPDNLAEAEACFRHAMGVARSQGARSWELRAATSLARLWQRQGKPRAAYDVLAPVYEWFTEGFDTGDLIDARALLDELA